jgi:uncharacterized lipoprotein YajG
MKKTIGLIIVASSLFLAGCCTTSHATKWQYKTVSSTSDEILNTPLAEGWIVVGFTVTPDGNHWFLLKHKQIH